MVRKGTGDPALQVEFIKVLTQRVSRASTASISVPVNCDYLTPGWNSSNLPLPITYTTDKTTYCETHYHTPGSLGDRHRRAVDQL